MSDSVLFLGPPLDNVVMAIERHRTCLQFELGGVRDFFDRHWLREIETSVFALRDLRDLEEAVNSHYSAIAAVADANLLHVPTDELILRLGPPYRSFADAQREVAEELWRGRPRRRRR